jgi:type I restriction enzyme S subunit
MNAELLLAHYDRISDASDAVARLRKFILDLAVRGKLVEQDAKDDPTSELLDQIASRRKDNRSKKSSKVGRSALGMSPEKALIETPPTWRWLRIDEIGITQTGTTPPSGEPLYFGNFIPFVKPADLNGNSIDYAGAGISEAGIQYSRLISKRSILMVCIGATLGKANLTDRDVCCNQQINAVTPYVDELAEFTLLALKASYFQELAWAKAGTGTLPILSKGKWEQLPIPVPPIAEQHRIVAKVDELMALCDRLEATQHEQETRREQLTASVHHHLNNGEDAEELRTHAQFFIGHFPRLTTRPDQIKQVRQTILNLAVRGKLVPQSPNDEQASKLLKRIEAEKRRLVRDGVIGKQASLATIDESTLPFCLPSGWCWSRLGGLVQLVTSGSRDWAKYYSSEGAIFLRMGNLSRDSYRLRLSNIQHVSPPIDGEGSRTKLKEGDILISITGEVGLLGLIPSGFGDAYINQHTCLVRPMEQLMGCYLPQVFCAPFGQEQFDEPQRGLKNSFRLTDVTDFLVPVPPLAEQHRIVAKVDELMVLCDKLEASLRTTKTETSRLLASVLHHALEASA